MNIFKTFKSASLTFKH